MNAIIIQEPPHVNQLCPMTGSGVACKLPPASSAHVKLALLNVIELGVYPVRILRSLIGYRAPARRNQKSDRLLPGFPIAAVMGHWRLPHCQEYFGRANCRDVWLGLRDWTCDRLVRVDGGAAAAAACLRFAIQEYDLRD